MALHSGDQQHPGALPLRLEYKYRSAPVACPGSSGELKLLKAEEYGGLCDAPRVTLAHPMEARHPVNFIMYISFKSIQNYFDAFRKDSSSRSFSVLC